MHRTASLLTIGLIAWSCAPQGGGTGGKGDSAKSAAAGSPAAAHVSAVADARAVWEGVTGYITASAEQVPEANYAFKPTPEVRSFGQLIAHIAGAQNNFCGTAMGENGGAEGDIEKTKTAKADIVAALKASNDYCRRAYAQSDSAAAAMTTLFGESRSRLYVLIENAAHDNEHYGNIVTYMRLKGMVPPSSQPQK